MYFYLIHPPPSCSQTHPSSLPSWLYVLSLFYRLINSICAIYMLIHVAVP